MANTKTDSNRNTYGALSYLLGFITGIYFFVTSKDKFVRFHALQSIITSVSFTALTYILGMTGLYMFINLVNLGMLAVFVYLIVQAYQGNKFKLPVIGDIAEKNA